ncbi:MAG: tripartite tricarboxylate transporter substrate binding protein [Burkholderiaceae bacterium]
MNRSAHPTVTASIARILVAIGLLLGATPACPGQDAAATGYPDRPVRLVVGFPPGTSTDIVARTVAEALRKRFEQPFVVENRPGANGMLAAEQVARAAPDGYTVLFTNTSAITLNPLVYKDIRYDVNKDFAPVTTVISVPALLLVSTGNPRLGAVQSVAELVAAGRTGTPLTYASLGNGNLFQLAGAELSLAAGIESLHVPYRAGLVSTALLGNEVDFTFDTLAALPQVRNGRLRALGVTSGKRWRELPEVPTLEEAGYPMLRYDLWTGVMAPRGTPQPILDTLAREIAAAARTPEAMARLTTLGDVLTMPPAQFAEAIRRELERNAAAVGRTGITAN